VIARTLLEPAELSSGDDPFSMFSGWDSGQLLWLAILVPVAVLVFSVGSRRARSQLGTRAILPRGRDRPLPGRGPVRDEVWRATVERLEARAVTAIAKAQAGPVRIQGVITGSSGNLGGAAGHECVWRNRAGAGPQTAVAAELLVVADDSGCCGVEELEQARVVAPADKLGMHHESSSLRIGDRIEIIGCFEPEAADEPGDPAQRVYGTLGGDGRLDIRVLERPSAEPTTTPTAKASDGQTGRAQPSADAEPPERDLADEPRSPEPSPSHHAPQPEPEP
jgi:hypothetical protein